MDEKKLEREDHINHWAKVVLLKKIQIFFESVFWVKFFKNVPLKAIAKTFG